VDASPAELSASVHWLTATAAGGVDGWLELLHTLTDGGEVEVRAPRTFYRTHHVVGGLVHVLSDPTGDGMPDVCIDVPGSACDFLGWDRITTIVGVADGLTRVDLAVDHAPFAPEQLAEADELGNIRTRSLSSTFYRGLRGDGGSTYQLGSKASARQLVAYDERGFTRCELRLRRERAEAARWALLGPPGAFLAAAVGLIRGMVDFVEASADENATRRPLLAWWASFVDGAARIVQELPERVASSVERKVAWIVGTVSRTLAALVAGGLDLPAILAVGAVEGRARHRALTHQMRVLAT
jgi:DNA relaxase NicK